VSNGTRWREGALWFGFALLVAAAIVTVVLPELGEAPEDDPTANAPDAGAQ
jgi:hypothetical protein